jgi:ABC-type transport system involved in cytochrome c biogenesis permease subunit
MLFNRIFAAIYLIVTVVGVITFFNRSSIQNKEYTFYMVFIFAIVQFIYFTVKINRLESKLNEKK